MNCSHHWSRFSSSLSRLSWEKEAYSKKRTVEERSRFWSQFSWESATHLDGFLLCCCCFFPQSLSGLKSLTLSFWHFQGKELCQTAKRLQRIQLHSYRNVTKLPWTDVWKAEFVCQLEYSVEISKQSVESVTWFLFPVDSKICEERDWNWRKNC